MVEDRRLTMNYDNPALGEYIKRFRAKHGMSQTELAERAHISGGYLSSIENGRARPSIMAWGKLKPHLKNGSVEVEKDNLEDLIQKIVDMGYDVSVSRRA
jgi:DNA-binding XRE family transcriptional regulator